MNGQALRLIRKLPTTMKKVLVFGATGAGKSSALQALTGDFSIPISQGSAIGTTFSCQELICEHNKVLYKFYDTCGLSEGQNGKVTEQEAIAALIHVLKQCKDGLSLIIFVSHHKITTLMKQNYEFVFNKLTGKMVPIVFLLTGCETAVKSREKTLLREEFKLWSAVEKKHYVAERLLAGTYIGSCFLVTGALADSDTTRNMVAASTENLWEIIELHSSDTPIQFLHHGSKFTQLLFTILLSLYKMFGWNLSGIYIQMSRIGNVLTEFGYSPEAAHELAESV